ELVANVGNVSVHGVLTQDELLGDLLVAQAARDQRQHLTLSSGERYHRTTSSRASWRLGRERRAQCAHHRVGIAHPREMGVTGERDQLRRRDPGGELAAQPIRDRAVVTAVHDDRGRTYFAELRPDVVAIDELQQDRRGLWARRFALVT